MALIDRTASALRRLVSPPTFEVQLTAAGARLRRGEVPPGLIVGLSDVARDLQLASGVVYGVRRRHGLSLEFSADVPDRAHQRLRNVLALHRHQIKDG